jgi:hypothetical protein
LRKKDTSVNLWLETELLIYNLEIRCRQEGFANHQHTQNKDEVIKPSLWWCFLSEGVESSEQVLCTSTHSSTPRKTGWWMKHLLTWDTKPLTLALSFNPW